MNKSVCVYAGVWGVRTCLCGWVGGHFFVYVYVCVQGVGWTVCARARVRVGLYSRVVALQWSKTGESECLLVAAPFSHGY